MVNFYGMPTFWTFYGFLVACTLNTHLLILFGSGRVPVIIVSFCFANGYQAPPFFYSSHSAAICSMVMPLVSPSVSQSDK